jgi:predicted HicB family RNase H-like nuclease
VHHLSYNSLVTFRISDGVLASAIARAERQGISLSELVRRAVDREIGGRQ